MAYRVQVKQNRCWNLPQLCYIFMLTSSISSLTYIKKSWTIDSNFIKKHQHLSKTKASCEITLVYVKVLQNIPCLLCKPKIQSRVQKSPTSTLSSATRIQIAFFHFIVQKSSDMKERHHSKNQGLGDKSIIISYQGQFNSDFTLQDLLVH